MNEIERVIQEAARSNPDIAEALRRGQEALNAAVESGDWERAMAFAGHAERGPLVLAHGDEMDDATYWRCVADAWQDSERQSLTPADWRSLFGADRPGREHLMRPEERRELAALPERVEVYRGVNAYSHVAGISWTLDREQAEWFARRFPERPDYPGFVWSAVVSGRVLRHRIIALFQARQESEVVVFPRYVYRRSVSRVAPEEAEEAGGEEEDD
jgi:hypothetical protein